MSQKNVNKFLAGAVTATMVATAVVTPAMAASFTDTGKLPEQIKGEVDRAVELGYFQDSEKFNPAASITRGQVALVIARQVSGVAANDIAGLKAYVAKHGLEEKVTPFADVKKGETELYYASLIVKDAGAFTQDSLNPASNITRSQMAKVVVTAFDLKMNEDNKKEITDIDRVSNKEYIEILASNGVTEPQNGKFNPGNNVTRSQMASFLVRAHDGVKEEVKEAKVESVKAINAKQILVTFSQQVGAGASTETNYAVRDIASGATNDVVSNGAQVQADGKSVLLTLTNEYRVSTDVSVVVDGIYVSGSIKDQFPKFSTVVNFNDTVAPTITSVKANKTSTGAAQNVTVTFSEPIQAGAIFRINGKTVSATNNFNNTVWSITSQDLEVGKTHELEVLHAKDYADHTVASLVKTFTVEQDTTQATGNVQTVQDNKVLVKFDKAVTAASLTNVKFFTYNGATYSSVNTVGSPTSSNGKDWTFTLDTTGFYGVNDNKEEVLVKVESGVVDTAGNPVKSFEQKVTFTQDTTGPSLQNVTMDKNSKGEVTKLYLPFDEYLTVDTDGDLQTYIDNNGTVQTPAADVAVANVDHYITLVDSSTNKAVKFTDLFDAPKTIKLATDGKTVIVELDSASTKKVTNGNYKLTANAGFVLDSAAGLNSSVKVTKDLNVAAVSNVVRVDKVTTTNAFDANTPPVASAGDNKFTVEFTQAVTAASAKNPANYQFNGKALPANTVITVDSDTKVSFELPASFIAKDENKAKLTVSNIQPKDSSAKFEQYLDVAVVLDNTAPVAKGQILTSGEIYLTFNEAVALDVNDFKNTAAKVYVNGLELTGTTLAFADGVSQPTPAGEDGVKITVQAKTAPNVNGFSYLYIDIDGDGVFDLNKDLVLAQVSGAAPTTWSATADLNSSVIKTVEVKTQSTDNATTDNSFLKNKLESDTIIKVK